MFKPPTLLLLLLSTLALASNVQFGPDTPSDTGAAGYFRNHVALNTKNLTAAIGFYTRAFGFRHIVTNVLSEHLSFAYMGHAQAGRDGAGYQTAREMYRDITNSAGLIELISFDVPAQQDVSASSEQTNTLAHLGIIVPDIHAAQDRLDGIEGVDILKRVGEPMLSNDLVAMANGFGPHAWGQLSVEEQDAIDAAFNGLNLDFLWIKDPDGNILEVQPLVQQLPQ
jgi:lactoylglutathione lyase